MPSYRELLAQVKGEIEEVDARTANEELAGASPPLLIDVRELDEYEQGAIPGAVHVPRGFLESRIENVTRDRSAPIIISCQSGARSAFAAKSLQDLGYENVRSLAGRLLRLEAERLRVGRAQAARRRQAPPLQPPPADPRGRRGGPAAGSSPPRC